MRWNLCALVLAASLLAGNVWADKMEYQLSTHVLDLNEGLPAADVAVELRRFDPASEQWRLVSRSVTDADGRAGQLLPAQAGGAGRGIYRLRFLTQPYFAARQQSSFYPYIEVVFQMEESRHYHVPITLNRYGYATYRGS